MAIFPFMNNKKRQKTIKQEAKEEVLKELKLEVLNTQYDGFGYTKPTTQFANLLRYLDAQENIGFIKKINGLKYHAYQVMGMLYNYGMVGFVKDKIGQVRMCQVTPTAWNENGYILKFRVIQGFQNYELLPSNKEYVNHVTGVILYDTFSAGSSHIPRAQLANIIIEQMVDLFQRLQDNVLLAGDRMGFVDIDVDNQKSLRDELTKQFQSGNPFVLLNSMFGGRMEQLRTDAKFMELWGNIKQYDMLRQRLHGFGNGASGNDKTERVLTDEVEGQAEAVNLVLNARKCIWGEWVQEMKDVLQTIVSVEFGV